MMTMVRYLQFIVPPMIYAMNASQISLFNLFWGGGAG